jgi:2-C-methyl-D-erythritol 4-phosphate cytidylyltransferase
MKTIAIILSSGTGSRSGLSIPKQFLEIKGKTVLEFSVEAFEKNDKIDEIIVVSNPDYLEKTKKLLEKFGKIKRILAGGKTRQESSSIGVYAIDENEAKVLIHDAVRPFVTQKIIDDCIEALDDYKAVEVAIESADTIVEIDENGCVKSIPQRKALRRVQTPQCFDLGLIKKAHELASKRDDLSFTDDCGLVYEFGLAPVKLIEGSDLNIKITYPMDVKLAETFLDMLD